MPYTSVALIELLALGSETEVAYSSKIGAGCQAMEEDGWNLVAVVPPVTGLDNALDAENPVFVFFKPAVEIAEPPIVWGQ